MTYRYMRKANEAFLRIVATMYDGHPDHTLSTAERGERDAARAELARRCKPRHCNNGHIWRGEGKHPASIYKLPL